MSGNDNKKRLFVVDPKKFPDLAGMMLATINALKAIGGSASIQELDEQIIEMEGISEEEQSFMMSNGRYRRLNYYLAWARTYLKRGGVLENSSRGVWALTKIGETITDISQVQKIHEQINVEERKRAKLKRQLGKSSDNEEKKQIEEILGFLEVENSNWQDELLSILLTMKPDAFERLAQRLLREAGFIKVEVRGKTGDGGIDGVGVLRVNLILFQVYFQCKRWKGSVGSKEIRDFRGALQGRADKGLFITTGNFTSHASEEATRDGAIAIDLIDGARLCELLKQFDLGIKTEMVEKIAIVENWFQEI